MRRAAREVATIRRSAARAVLVCCSVLLAAYGIPGVSVLASASPASQLQTPAPSPSGSGSGGSGGGCPTSSPSPSPSPSSDATPSPSPSQSAGGEDPCATPAPTPAPAPSAGDAPLPGGVPRIQLVNPFGDGQPVKVSDKFDGIDATFEIVARVVDPPPGAIVEATVDTGPGGERNIGPLRPVTDAAGGVWSLGWGLSDDLPKGPATLRVRLFRPGASAGEYPAELASDAVEVDLQHFDEPCAPGAATCTPKPAAETANLTWPLQGGALGFYRTKDGKWVTVVDGTASKDATGVSVRYSTTPAGQDPVFKDCGGTEKSLLAREKDPKTKLFRNECVLTEADVPSAVTAVAAVSGSTSARVVVPYLQQPSEMSVALSPLVRRTTAGSECQDVTATVTDAYERPVKGVNLDVQLQGPGDSAYFGLPADSQPPDGATVEPASNCARGDSGEQGVSVVALEGDIKQLESVAGPDFNGEWKFKVFSAESGMTEVTAFVDDEDFVDEGVAQARDDDFLRDGEPFGVARRQWLDKVLQVKVTPANDTAPVGACNAYTVTAYAGDTVLPGVNVDLHVRFPNDKLMFCDAGGNTRRRDPDKGEHPPNNLGHSHKPNTDPHCPGAGPSCRHIEGETDERGRFTVGLTSAVLAESPDRGAGIARLTAWVDGEPGEDDDVLAPFGAEPSATATTNWVVSATHAEVKLLNPVNNTRGALNIGSAHVDVMARVDAPYVVDAVEILLGSTKLGEAERIGSSDTYLFEWDLQQPPGTAPTPTPTPSSKPGRPTPTPPPSATPAPTPTPVVSPPPTVSPPATVSPPPTPAPVPSVNAPPGPGVADGRYKLRARIKGTGRSDEVDIVVDRTLSPSTSANTDTTPALEWARLQSPANGAVISLVNGGISVEGTASAGAEGVYVYYAAGSGRDPLRWSPVCGFAKLAGTGSTAQPFETFCALGGDDLPGEVVAVWAVAFDCTAPGCDANPSPTPVPNTTVTPPAPQGVLEAGDMSRLFACADSPCVVAHPGEWLSYAGACQKVVIEVGDSDGKPVAQQNVDVTFAGPSDRLALCDVGEGASAVRAPFASDPSARVGPDGRYTVTRVDLGPDVFAVEGETGADGRLVFGLTSRDSGYDSIYAISQDAFSSLTAWADLVDDDRRTTDEAAASSTFSWDLPERCTIVGTADADVLLGSVQGSDKMCGLGGDDTFYAQEGDDLLLGGEGNDDLWGDDGDDRVAGGPGDDLLRGGPGKDSLNGGAGADRCDGGRGKTPVEQCEQTGRIPPP